MPRNTPWIAGLNFSHNGSVCLLKGDRIVVAVQEERLSRVKRAGLTGGLLESRALAYCLNTAGIGVDDVDLFVAVNIKDRPLLKAGCHSLNAAVSSNGPPLMTIPHYLAHACAGYANSGFKDAVILVVDGLGESLPLLRDFWPEELSNAYHADFPKPENGDVPEDQMGEIIGIYHASGSEIELVEKHIGGWLVPGGSMSCFGSLGAMYSSAAKLIFGEALDAGKVMGLAPYGTIKYPAKDFLIIDSTNILHFSDRIPKIFRQFKDGWPCHKELFQDLACSIQNALEQAVFHFLRRCRDVGTSNNFVYSGGVALNSVANEKMIRKKLFNRHYIVPAAEDGGLAIGAAYYGLWQMTRIFSSRRLERDSLGKSYSTKDIEKAVNKMPRASVRYSGPIQDAVDTAVEYLLKDKIIGWFNGGAEFGPRALGQRSILCDPRRTDAKEIVNARVKHREPFRPFAPMILLEEVGNWFNMADGEFESPFMLRVCDFKEDVKHLVPAVVHVDGTGRIQTVSRKDNGITYACLKKFFDMTGVPILLNTSFNVMNEPIVETPEDALWCLLFSDLDAVIFEKALVAKDKAFQSLLDYRPKVLVDVRSMKSLPSKNRSPGYVHPSQLLGTDPFYIRGDAAIVLALCGGTGSGWELLDKVSRMYGSGSDPWNAFRVLNALGVLKRCGLIDF